MSFQSIRPLHLEKFEMLIGRGYSVIVAYLGLTEATPQANFICSLILHISVKAQKTCMHA